MKNFINRIKFKLLNWLLEDICQRCASCEICSLGTESDVMDGMYECISDDIRAQAKKTWEVEQ